MPLSALNDILENAKIELAKIRSKLAFYALIQLNQFILVRQQVRHAEPVVLQNYRTAGLSF